MNIVYWLKPEEREREEWLTSVVVVEGNIGEIKKSVGLKLTGEFAK